MQMAAVDPKHSSVASVTCKICRVSDAEGQAAVRAALLNDDHESAEHG